MSKPFFTVTQCCPREKSLSSRIPEDQFTSPCPCPFPRTLTPWQDHCRQEWWTLIAFTVTRCYSIVRRVVHRRPADVVRQTRPARSTGRRGRRNLAGRRASPAGRRTVAPSRGTHRPYGISRSQRRLLRVLRLPRTAEGSRTAQRR